MSHSLSRSRHLLFPQSSHHCGSDLWTRTPPLTCRKCGAVWVNERFHVGGATLTAGGEPLRHSEGFSMFLWCWEYCSALILLVHCANRISLLFWLLHFFLFFLIVYCLCELWNISTYQSVSWRHIMLPPWNIIIKRWNQTGHQIEAAFCVYIASSEWKNGCILFLMLKSQSEVQDVCYTVISVGFDSECAVF